MECSSLTNVKIPNSVTSIGDWAFDDCGALTDVYFGGTEADWNKIEIGDSNEPLTAATIHYTEAATVVSGTCGENLTWTLTDDGVLTISGTGAMTDYTSTSNAPWYSKRTDIKSAVIESGVTSIGNYAFYNCSSLTSITIPDGVTSIGGGAFEGCSSLTNVYYGGTEAEWNKIEIDSSNDKLTGATIHYGEIAPTPTPSGTSVPGDVNGDGEVSAFDLLRLKKLLAGGSVSTDASAADVNGDGTVDAFDLLRLKKYLAGAAVELK